MDNLILQKLSKGFKFFHKKNTLEQQAEYRQQLERELMQILSELQSSTPEQVEQRQALVNEVLTAIQNYFNQKSTATSSQTVKVEELEQLLLPICRLVHLEENNGNPEEQAWKLAVTFPDFEATMSYLNHMLETSKAKDTRPVLHDACLYALSSNASKEKISNWDSLSKWQQLAKDNMNDPEFRELLAHAPDIELSIKQEAQKAWQEAKQNNPKAKFGAMSQNKKQDIKEAEDEITALQKRYKDIKNKRINPGKFGECSEQDNAFYDNYSKTLNAALITLAEKYQGLGFKSANMKMIKAFYAKHKATAETEFSFFLKHGLTKQNYAKFTALQRVDDDTRIPPITIDGKDIGEEGYYLRRLNVENSADAAMAACLGKLSGCCQSLSGQAGEPCTIHGLTSREGGFYVVCKGDVNHPNIEDELMAQSWVWRSQSGAMVIDSVESNKYAETNNDRARKFYHALSAELITGEYAIPLISHGANSGISPSIATSEISANEPPIDYSDYRDSSKQNVLASKALLFLLPEKTEQFVTELEDCKEFKAIKFIEYALKKNNDNFLSIFRDQFREPGQAVIETCQTYLNLLENEQEEITLETIQTLHQEAMNVLIVSNTSGKTIFHLKVANPEHLKMIIDLSPQEQRFDAVTMVDKDGHTPIHQAVSNPYALKTIFDSLPENQRRDAVWGLDGDGDILLHKATSNPESLKIILDLYSKEKCLDIVKMTDNNGHPLLELAASNPESFNIILDLYPIEQRLDAVKLANKDGSTPLHRAASTPETFKTILDLYPQEQRLDAVMVTDKYGKTPLFKAISTPECLKIILDLYPQEQRIDALTLKSTYDYNTPLDTEDLEPESLKVILESLPTTQRLDAIRMENLYGETLLSRTSSKPKSLQVIIELLSETQLIDVITQTDKYGLNLLYRTVSKPESLKILLESMPEPQRLDALKEIHNSTGGTLLHESAKNPESLKIILGFIPKEQLFDELRVADRNGSTPLLKAASNPESLKIILDLYPEEQRLDALKMANKIGTTPLSVAANYLERFRIILESLPQTQRLDAIKVADRYGQIPLQAAISNPDYIKMVLNSLPQTLRLDAVNMAGKDGKTILHKTSARPKIFKTILDTLPNTDKLKAIEMLASTTLNPEVQAIVDEFKSSAIQTDAVNPHRLFSPSVKKQSSDSHQNEEENNDAPTRTGPTSNTGN